jgi:hypothetical protein
MWYSGLMDTTYAIPDAVDFTNIPSACFRELETTIVNDTGAWEYEASLTGFMIGIDIDGISIGVSFAKQMADLRALTHNYTYALSIMNHAMPTYRLSVDTSPSNLDPEFVAAVDHLPTTPSPDYAQMVEYWGTHYLAGADVGGACNFTVLFNQSAVTDESAHWVFEQIFISIGIMYNGIGIDVDFGYNVTKMTESLSKKFAENSHTKYECVGGDVALLDNGLYSLWSESVHRNPQPIPPSLQLRPISDLVYDPVKSKLLKQAVVTYLNSPDPKH